MLNCPTCSKEIARSAVSCPSCGTVLEEQVEVTRMLSETQRHHPTRWGEQHVSQRGTRSPSSFESIDDARFVPGEIIAERYRIVGLLGRGGMAEVYRADDLKLGQPVALKFLPEFLLTDGAAVARFHREVRISRQVTHRNVCRVYDIGEVDGQHYISMEFIKGEELASLIRRIGRLPRDKATEIARQLCAGIAAAHDNGVLHRDLKPANIMIDSDGNVRITDFGLAGLAEEIRTEAIAGTPSYMSPEQIEGKELTTKSDIYSLGLVLYELFTGKKAFEASSLVELMHLRKTYASPTLPTIIVGDLDQTVERVILRCIEKDPDRRPASALQVAAALPGGDPLAAALAAGETPSPEMVAAASTEEALRPSIGMAMLAAIVVAIAAAVFLSGKVTMHGQVTLDKSPEALAERATSIAHKFGYTDIPTDVTYEFTYDTAFLRYILQNDSSKLRWQQLRNSKAAPLTFTYSESPRYFEPYIDAVSIDDPPIPSNMATVILDTRGQLQKFVAAPPQVDQTLTSVIAPNWSIVLAEAGLDIANLKQVGSTWVPPVNSDSRLAWEGEYIGQPSLPIRVEAAAYRGRPVYFEIIAPWTKPHRMEQEQPLARTRILIVLAVALGLIVFCAALLFARHNLKLGRGDRKNAFKLAFFVFVLHVLIWLFGDHHVFSLQGEFKSLMLILAFSALAAMFMWLIYIALEPSLRRRWPHRIISWNRLLAGNIRNALVGRDILIGAFAGAILLLNRYIWNYLSQWLGSAPEMPLPVPLQAILGSRFLASVFFTHLISALINPAIFMLLLLLLSSVLRRERLAIALFWVLAVVIEGLASTNIITGMLYGAIGATVFLIILIRFGLLAGIFAEFFFLLGIFYPLTSDLSAWYSGATFFAVVIGLAVAIYGFYVSLAGQPLFKGGLLQD